MLPLGQTTQIRASYLFYSDFFYVFARIITVQYLIQKQTFEKVNIDDFFVLATEKKTSEDPQYIFENSSSSQK